MKKMKPHVNIGTLGHVGHGKTSLQSAIKKLLVLSGLMEYRPDDFDKTRYYDCRFRIGMEYEDYETHNRHYVHVDCFEHTDHIKNMITGSVQVDSAILVVSATEGPTQQTHEQVRLASLVGVSAIVVFLNKVDLVDDEELLQVVELETLELLSDYGFPAEKSPIVRGSALEALEETSNEPNAKAYGPLWALLDAMDHYIPTPVRHIDLPFLMEVEDVFSIKGRGTVVTGRVEHGIVKLNEPVDIVGLRDLQNTTVTRIEMLHKLLNEAQAGDNVGIFLRDLKPDDVERGQVLAKPGSIGAHTKFEAEAYISRKDEGGGHTLFFNGYSTFYMRTMDIMGRINLPEGVESVMPGDHTTMTIQLTRPVALEKWTCFIIHESGRRLGRGIVTKIIE